MKKSKFKKIFSVVISILILSSSILPASAVTTVDNEPVSATEISEVSNSLVQNNTIEETTETTVEPTTSIQTTNATQTEQTTEVTKSKSDYEKSEQKENSKKTKKNIESVSAQTKVESLQAVSYSSETTYPLSEIVYMNGEVETTLDGATATITRYSTKASGNYQFTYKSNGATYGKVYKIVFSFAINSTKFTATWQADTTSLKSTTEDDATGTLKITSNSSTANLPNFKEPEKQSDNTYKYYTPWKAKNTTTGNTVMNTDRITSVKIGSNINSIGNHSFRGLNACKSVTFDNTCCKTIGEMAFYNLDALESISFNNAPIEIIQAKAFYGCDNLKSSTVNGSSTAPANPGNRTLSNVPVLTLPYTVTDIKYYAFATNTSLQVVTWGKRSNESLSAPQLTTIEYGAFRNCYKLYYFDVPDNCTDIQGTDSVNSSNSDPLIGTLVGAFYVDSDNSQATDYPTYSFWVALNPESSKLQKIGNDAFRHNSATKTGKGVRFFEKKLDGTAGTAVNSNEIFIMPNVTKIGSKAFFHNAEFTGILQFEKYVNIGAEVFVYTNLTDLYFKWNPTKEVKNTTNIQSSQIGSSNQYVSNNTNMGYSDSTYSPPDGYFSLYTLLNNESNGLIKLWQSVFKNVPTSSKNFQNWSSSVKGTPSQPAKVPELTYDTTSGTTTKDSLTDINTASYLQTKAEWDTAMKTAKETVTFAYKNETKVDYVFVVDNSPSMDEAAKSKNSTKITDEIGTSYTGTYNASKMMNEYSQIYDISKRVLANNSGNTVTVISFNGNSKNQLKASSKYLGDDNSYEGKGIGITDTDSIYNALFKSDYGYDDGGVTNYSAGLSRAYKALETLQEKYPTHKQVVVFLTDGSPTYTDGTTHDVSPTDTSDYAIQVNGDDWAKAIRGNTSTTYSVRSYEKSYMDTTSKLITNEIVKGLNVPIYGILVGTDDATAKQNVNKVTLGTTSDGDHTKSSKDINELGTSLASIINSATAEDYVVIIPLDNNFTYLSNKPITITSDNGSATIYGDTNDNGIKNKFYFDADNPSFGQIQYNSTRNCIIWDLSTHSNTDLTSSYETSYKLTFYLKYKKGGKTVSVSGTNYCAVNDNDSATSLNTSSTIGSVLDSTASLNSSSNTLNYGIASGTSKGAYVYLSKGNNTNITYSTTTTVNGTSYTSTNTSSGTPAEEISKVKNVTAAIYLPIVTGTLYLNKYDDSGTRLAGAKFEVYDEDLNKLTFSNTGSTEWTCDKSATYTDVSTYSSASTSICKLPYGTYYLYESDYPTSTLGTYDASSKNSYSQVDVDKDGKKENVIKVEIGNSTVTTNIYNTFKKGSCTLSGTKYYMDGRDSGAVGNVVGATMALYTNLTSAQNGSSDYIATAVTDRNANYSFKVDSLGTYYVREIKAPEGLQISRVVSMVTVSSLNENCKFSTIYDFELAKITVYTDSSDNIQKGFSYTLNCSSTDVKDASLAIAVSCDSKGNYSIAGYGVGAPKYFTDDDGDGVYENSELTHRVTIQDDGTLIFEVPLYNAYTYTDNRGIPCNAYEGITYTITETGYKGGSIPTKYIYQEYGLNSYNNTKKADSYSFSYEDWSERFDVYNPAYTNPARRIYIYNPSIKVTIYNYDATDKTTPLQSTFSSIGKYITTDKNGYAEYPQWVGYTSLKITQTKVQSGYNLLSDDITFTIDSSKYLPTAYDSTTGNKYYSYTVIVYNSKTSDLPKTGGNGYLWIIAVGVIVLLFGSSSFVLYKRHKKHNNRIKKDS
jgi:LPXTG-motif cell wall-anchored protein